MMEISVQTTNLLQLTTVNQGENWISMLSVDELSIGILVFSRLYLRIHQSELRIESQGSFSLHCNLKSVNIHQNVTQYSSGQSQILQTTLTQTVNFLFKNDFIHQIISMFIYLLIHIIYTSTFYLEGFCFLVKFFFFK